ncbi:MAG: class I SAM-dependent methyltransferase [Bacillus sp. (in: firmicutes)]
MKNILKIFLDSNSNSLMTYKDFIQLALYHSTAGYYQQEKEKIGAIGDFYTSSNVSDVFGRALGRWFLHIFSTYQLPLQIIEIGSGTGRTAHAILSYIQEHNNNVFQKLCYISIETSSYHRQKQEEILEHFDNVMYVADIEQLKCIEGIVFSNELFDAFPVHVVEKKAGVIYEVMVGMQEDSFIEVYRVLDNQAIIDYLDEQELQLANGQRIEIPLPMKQYYSYLCEKINQAVLVTIDYGYTNEEWQEAIHRKGSLRGYRHHRMVENVLKGPGEMDITSHIHWDALQRIGETFGAHTQALLPQHEFLLACGILEELQNAWGMDAFSPQHTRNRAIRTLIQPGQISSYFKVLIQTKGFNGNSEGLWPSMNK